MPPQTVMSVFTQGSSSCCSIILCCRDRIPLNSSLTKRADFRSMRSFSAVSETRARPASGEPGRDGAGLAVLGCGTAAVAAQSALTHADARAIASASCYTAAAAGPVHAQLFAGRWRTRLSPGRAGRPPRSARRTVAGELAAAWNLAARASSAISRRPAVITTWLSVVRL